MWKGTQETSAPIVSVRVRESGVWSAWSRLNTDDAQADPGSPDAISSKGRQATEPLFVALADAIRVRLTATPTRGGPSSAARLPSDLRAVLVDPGRSPADTPQSGALSRAAAFPSQPAIITRAQWGADESIRQCTPSLTSTIKAAFVHHTVSTNDYSPADSAALVRGIYAYHVLGRGWCDIGYNFLVDKYGQVFEGRYGGLAAPVLGAHTGGFNSDSFGVALIGDYSTATPSSPMLRSLEQVLSWKLNLYGRDPLGTTQLTSSGGESSRYPAGQVVTFNVISGHRDAGYTECPGNNVYPRLPEIRLAAAGLSAPIGSLDGVQWSGPGRVRVFGWSIDPTTVDPIRVSVSVDGSGAFALSAAGYRGDVGAAFPMYGPWHGFDASLDVGGGQHTVCVSGINVGAGYNTTLGCSTVSVPSGNPTGNLETASWAGPGLVSVSGWALDFDAYQSIQVHVWVDGSTAFALNADQNRSDVAALYPAYGSSRGFSGVLPVGPGVHTLCAYGINVGYGSNALIGCRTATVAGGDPVGSVDAMTSVRSGVVRVSGWALDFDTYDSIPVHVWVDGSSAFATLASTSRPDVAALWPAYGDRRGFSVDVTASPGPHQVCAYAINAGPGVNTVLQCRTVAF